MASAKPGGSPHGSLRIPKPGLNHGTYVPENVDFVDGVLRLKVEQTQGPDGVISKGAAIWTKEKFGYGTYEFVMRMASESQTPNGPGHAQSGTVSSAFSVLQNSETEMDIEFLGDKNSLWTTNYHNINLKATRSIAERANHGRDPQCVASDQFHTYKLVWQPDSVEVVHRWSAGYESLHQCTNRAAYIILQIRGTNSDEWGGKATVNAVRYAYVKSVKYYPA